MEETQPTPITSQTSTANEEKAPSRQVRRANARKVSKQMTRRLNEQVNGRNRRRTGNLSFLNRQQYRLFMSNRCPKSFKVQVAKALATAAAS